jgi:hypothetical protein
MSEQPRHATGWGHRDPEAEDLAPFPVRHGESRSATPPDRWRHPVGYLLAAVVGFAIGNGVAGRDDAAAGVKPAAVATRPAAPTMTPTADDFAVTVTTLSKQCFGAAGCNVEVRLEVSRDSSTAGAAGELSVEITGDESGPVTETIVLDAGGRYDPPEVVMSTRSSGTPVEARVSSFATF